MGDEERAAFMKLAGDDAEIDAYELQDILNQEFKKRPLSVMLLFTPTRTQHSWSVFIIDIHFHSFTHFCSEIFGAKCNFRAAGLVHA